MLKAAPAASLEKCSSVLTFGRLLVLLWWGWPCFSPPCLRLLSGDEGKHPDYMRHTFAGSSKLGWSAAGALKKITATASPDASRWSHI